MVRRRLDAELVRRGLAGSPMEARDAVRAGLVVVAGRPATKASTLVGPADPVELAGSPKQFVSRTQLSSILSWVAVRRSPKP